MRQIKVLHLVPGLASGGISSVILNYYRHMNRDNVKFDFAVFMPELGYAAEEFKKLGSEITVLPRKSKNMKAYKEKLMDLMKDGGYDIVHAHQNYQSFIPLRYAKKCGITVRIAHAHSTRIDRVNIVKKIIKWISPVGNAMAVTDYFACGKDAGKVMFGSKMESENARVLKNSVVTERYAFSKETRSAVRDSMGWNGKFIVGNVGRIAEEKNQLFLVDVFSEVAKLNANAVLCICGDGPDREKLVSHIKSKGLEDKVQLLGNRNDVTELMNGFDVFVLPSLFEGLPVTGIEALVNGIPCVLSDTITKEFDEYGKIKFIPLDESVSIWAETILEEGKKGHDSEMGLLMRKVGYEIADSAKELEQFYMDKVFKGGK